MPIDIKKIKPTKVGSFNFKKLKDKYLLTNDLGDYIFLNEKDFEDFVNGNLDKESSVYKELDQKFFTREAFECEYCQERMIQRYHSSHDYLLRGPSLHIVVVTLRCDHACRYCHASAKSMRRTDLDMNRDTAKKVVNMIFQTTSPSITIEFQGGEPLANFDVVKFVIDYALEKNQKIGKDLLVTVVSNFSLLDDKKLDYLLSKKVALCTSLDGPAKVHDKNRPMLNGKSSYEAVIKGIKKAKEKYKELGYRINALLTVSHYSLGYWKEIIDEYVKLGFVSIHLRPLNPFGMAKKTEENIWYEPEEFIDFYKKSLNYIIELNLKGIEFKERTAAIILQKAFTGRDANFLDLRSPCGAGIGQIAYNYNGDIYTCDEGRMLGQMGDSSFKMGNVNKDSYGDIINSSVTKSTCLASTLEGLPGCSDCVYRPYCGVCPVYNYSEEGNIFSQMPGNKRCQIQKAILDFIFEKLQDEKIKKIFEKWVGEKPKSYLMNKTHLLKV